MIIRLRYLVVALCLSTVLFGLTQPVLAADRTRELRAIYGDHTMYSDECAPQTSTSGSVASGKVYLIGDSISEGAIADLDGSLKSKGFSEVVIDAKASRRLSEGGGELDGLSVLANSKDILSNAGTVVIQLGTNGGLSEENIKKAIDLVKAANASAQIHWVNVGANNAAQTSGSPIDTNGLDGILKSQASLGYNIIDWKKVVDENPGFIASDGLGVHPTPVEGRAAFVGAIVNSFGSSPQSVTQPATNPCECSVAGLLPGTDNREKIWNFLVSKGLDAIQTAGVMGNLQAESGFNPGAVEGGSGIGFGLAQWSFGRRTALEQAAADQGVPADDLNFQLNYLYDEANQRPIDRSSGYPDGMSEWEGQKQQKTISDAVLFFHTEFEVSNDDISKLANRVNFGEIILSELGSSVGTNSSTSGGSCATGANGEIVGGFALPVDRKFYDENPEWFTKPHHDYPAADIPVPTGTPIYSMTAGTVIAGGVEPGGCGQGVMVQLDNGSRFIYCHGSDGSTVPGAQVGDQVQAGQLIMHSASTGSSTGPHLHLGIFFDGKKLCPQPLFVGIINGQVPTLESLPDSGCSY